MDKNWSWNGVTWKSISYFILYLFILTGISQSQHKIEPEAVWNFLEKGRSRSSSHGAGGYDDKNAASSSATAAASSYNLESRPLRFFLYILLNPADSFGPSKSLGVLLNDGNFRHGGATAMLVDLVGSAVIYTEAPPLPSVSVEINISFLDASYLEEGLLVLSIQEEIEIEAKNLRVGKAIAVASVEFREKTTGKIIAQGHHTNYLIAASKM